jgi:hypothetical protein
MCTDRHKNKTYHRSEKNLLYLPQIIYSVYNGRFIRVRTKPKTVKCPYIPQKTVFFVSKPIVFVKSIRKTYKNFNFALNFKYFNILPAELKLLIQLKN